MVKGQCAKEGFLATAPVFKETYAGYLAQIGGHDLSAKARTLGFEMESDEARINYFNRTYWVSARGIHDRDGITPDLSVSVVLCKYILMGPESLPDARELRTFKDFRNAAPLVHFFENAVQKKIAERFQWDINALERACVRLDGRIYTADLGYQVKYQFSGLPKVPVYLLFNDAEEGFAAQCTLLFERSVEALLDMESLAMVGSTLARWL
jgi:hypothetical protein